MIAEYCMKTGFPKAFEPSSMAIHPTRNPLKALCQAVTSHHELAEAALKSLATRLSQPLLIDDERHFFAPILEQHLVFVICCG
ncbi:hypothetical protein K5D51_07240 [Pseudomonas cichorii]|nr:hypothetical protein [Pseudomonas cichorii]MBX8539447.1 hypothetical protein [Pseudomonas cichorii]MBX8554118.1 hypothetical protein [Pseudomonas cichorii]MBX8579375.1 hypothetical protein [Pseudomonas cichorii]